MYVCFTHQRAPVYSAKFLLVSNRWRMKPKDSARMPLVVMGGIPIIPLDFVFFPPTPNNANTRVATKIAPVSYSRAKQRTPGGVNYSRSHLPFHRIGRKRLFEIKETNRPRGVVCYTALEKQERSITQNMHFWFHFILLLFFCSPYYRELTKSRGDTYCHRIEVFKREEAQKYKKKEFAVVLKAIDPCLFYLRCGRKATCRANRACISKSVTLQ